jgi:hypothetical protein
MLAASIGIAAPKYAAMAKAVTWPTFILPFTTARMVVINPKVRTASIIYTER